MCTHIWKPVHIGMCTSDNHTKYRENEKYLSFHLKYVLSNNIAIKVNHFLLFRRTIMTNAVKNTEAMVVVSQENMLEKLQHSEVIMSPPFRVGRHIVFPRASVCLSVCPSVCLSVTNRVRSITWKPLKLYSWNFIQISISMRWRAECKNGNSALYTFGVISLWTLCITKIVSAL